VVGNHQTKNITSGLDYLLRFSIDLHAFIDGQYTGSRQIPGSFDFNHTHTARSGTGEVGVMAQGWYLYPGRPGSLQDSAVAGNGHGHVIDKKLNFLHYSSLPSSSFDGAKATSFHTGTAIYTELWIDPMNFLDFTCDGLNWADLDTSCTAFTLFGNN